MFQDYWCKKLSDGSFEFGRDSDIEKKIVSWTRGRQDIIEAQVRLNNKHIKISASDGVLTNWEQLDNFSFNPRTGESKRLSRELRCSINGQRFIRKDIDITPVYIFTSFVLNNRSGDLIPKDAKTLVCRILRDGRVEVIWR